MMRLFFATVAHGIDGDMDGFLLDIDHGSKGLQAMGRL